MPPKGFKRNETGYIKWINKSEIELLLRALDKEELQWKLIIYLMAYMGLRRGEVARLKWSDIIGDYDKTRVTLHKQKGRIIERIIPKKVKSVWKRYEKIWKPKQKGNYVFEPQRQSGSKNPYLLPDTITAKIKTLREKVGLTDSYYNRKEHKLARISAHTFRHYFITQFYQKSGKDIILTQRVIGHKKMSTTANYIFEHKTREERIVNLIE